MLEGVQEVAVGDPEGSTQIKRGKGDGGRGWREGVEGIKIIQLYEI